LERLGNILERDIHLPHMKLPARFVVSTLFVAFVKIALAAFLYASLQLWAVDGFWMDAARVEPLAQNEILLDPGSKAARWAYLFLGWDGAWYASIAAKGYSFSDQSFAFMPGLPHLARLLQGLLGVIPALVVSSLVLGVLWVPLFQSVAEHYSGKTAALVGALLFALSPFTLLFTTVAYSEGLFLFATLAAWRLYLGKSYLPASIAAAAAALVRVPGFLIVLPMVAGLLGSPGGGGRVKAALIGAPTALALLGWAAFMGARGDPLAILHTTEWSGMYTLPTFFLSVLPAGGLNALSLPVAYLNVHWLLPPAVWGSVLLLPLPLRRLWAMDRSLGVYSLAYLAGVFAFGAAVSAPRFLSVLFPLWLPFSDAIAARRWVLAPLIAGYILVCGVLWAGFLGGVFVG
jgi:hypothetical protein